MDEPVGEGVWGDGGGGIEEGDGRGRGGGREIGIGRRKRVECVEFGGA